ncbi:hypothetical protein FRC07_010414 [Ceratobasidium sp. 392]|nr:hypothetical protein FRC07_010414 [Ceratobasidium sp. 392]
MSKRRSVSTLRRPSWLHCDLVGDLDRDIAERGEGLREDGTAFRSSVLQDDVVLASDEAENAFVVEKEIVSRLLERANACLQGTRAIVYRLEATGGLRRPVGEGDRLVSDEGLYPSYAAQASDCDFETAISDEADRTKEWPNASV